MNSKAPSSRPPKASKKIFKNFEEYWTLVKALSESQRDLLTESLSVNEKKSLRVSYDKGGWKDVFIRNVCDSQLDVIKKQFDVDLIQVRTAVMSGTAYLINKNFWSFINDTFENFEWDNISYIFDGMVTEPYDDHYVKLVRYNKNKK